MTPTPPRALTSLLAALALAGAAAAAEPRTLSELDAPFLFGYGTWEGTVAVEAGAARIAGVNGKGGAGANVTLDLSAAADHSPVLHLRVGPGNRAKALRLLLRDAEGVTATFHYPLAAAAGPLTPRDADPLSTPGEDEAKRARPLDLSRITQFQLQGDWQDAPLDVTVDRITIAPPDADMLAARRAKRQRVDAEEAARRDALAQARARVKHAPTSPAVERVAAVDRDILGITIQAGRIPPVKPQPYEPRPGDQLEDKGGPVLQWRDGQVVSAAEQVRVLRPRDEGAKPEFIGWLLEAQGLLFPPERLEGDPLEELLVDLPESYEITSRDDDRYATPTPPLAVHRKSKPSNHTEPERHAAMLHRVYLVLPHPLRDGATYEVRFVGLNTREPSAPYTHDSRRSVSEAVHASHIGYRPDDPFKRAYLSLWLGTGGGHTFDDAPTFELLDDATGDSVFTGDVTLAKAEDASEQLKESKNYTGTAVYHLDFSDFDTPGAYRVHVPGIGTSEPFRIADDVWAQAFRVSMHGFLSHRSGIALGPPFTTYERPRPFHPADGVKVFELDATTLDGESGAVHDSLKRIGTDGPTLSSAWGGYMDAGDWDRRSQHLDATYLHLELLELFPQTLERIQLALPPEESGNRIPDTLDEALWNLAFYRRIQRDDGGVRGGVESTAHPRPGEPSWHETLLVGAFAPDPLTSYRFAAAAAKASRVLAPYDSADADAYRDAAARAYAWADAHRDAFTTRNEKWRGGFDAARLLAAVELFHATREPRYEADFLTLTVLTEEEPDLFARGDQRSASFAYARLPADLGDPALKARAVAATRRAADAAIAFGHGNSFNLTKDRTGLPVMGWVGYFSVPDAITLPRAHALTGDPRYLAGALMAANFAVGANPDNMTFTTGLGHRGPLNPLHLDSRRTGQPAPAGITVYGPGDPAASKSSDWMHTYFLGRQMTPSSRSWPPHEGYTDTFMWPETNEYTVHQTFGPTSYVWGYLAARPQ